MAAFCYRNNNKNSNDPVNNTGNIEAIPKAMAPPGLKEEHVYDTIKYDDICIIERKPKDELHHVAPNIYQNSPTRVNKAKVCPPLKSHEVSFSESRICQAPTVTTKKTNREKPKPPIKPKYANVHKVTPVPKTHHHIPTTAEPPPLEEEYIFPESKHPAGDQYVFMDQTQGAKKSVQHTPLGVSQSTAYQGLANRPALPKFTVPRRLPVTK